MTRIIKIALVGLSGSGKTTTLKLLCKNLFLPSEMQRLPTEKEAIAWNIPRDHPINTTVVTNYGIITIKDTNNGIKIQENTIHGENIYVVTVHDTIGYAKLHDLNIKIGDELFRHTALNGCEGLLFLADSALDLYDDEHPNRILHAFHDLQEYYARTQQRFPILIFVVNKQDLIQKTLVEQGSTGRIAKFIARLRDLDKMFHHVPFVNASAKDGWGIQEAFSFLIKGIIELRVNEVEEKTRNIKDIRLDSDKKETITRLEQIYAGRHEDNER